MIDHDRPLRKALVGSLQPRGYSIAEASDRLSAIGQIDAAVPDLIILERTLPDCDGLDLLPLLRLRGQIPVVMLSTISHQQEKINALNLGADDYVTKPFDVDELLARVAAVLRRAQSHPEEIHLGDVMIDFQRRRASRRNRALTFSHREFELLAHLSRRRGAVVSRNELLHVVWGCLDTDGKKRTVDFAVGRLRKKIEADRRRPRFIRSAYGDGYYLVDCLQDSAG